MFCLTWIRRNARRRFRSRHLDMLVRTVRRQTRDMVARALAGRSTDAGRLSPDRSLHAPHCRRPAPRHRPPSNLSLTPFISFNGCRSEPGAIQLSTRLPCAASGVRSDHAFAHPADHCLFHRSRARSQEQPNVSFRNVRRVRRRSTAGDRQPPPTRSKRERQIILSPGARLVADIAAESSFAN